MATHQVTNQPGELVDVDLFTADPVLEQALGALSPDLDVRPARDLGPIAGSRDFLEWGFQANRNLPELRTHDRFGHRIDEVAFHPAYHDLMRTSVAHGLTSLPYEEGAPADAHLLRASMFFLTAQIEQGHGCPVSMTYAVLPSLRRQPDVAKEWEDLLATRRYDPACRPADRKAGALMGMGMTEKQGGSDVRANTTRAQPVGAGGPGGEYLLTGHKWFCSAPMCDAFLVLAQAPGGLSCFLLPRFTPDGERNVFRIQRLKDKLGNRSNASSEVEFDGTWARMVGEEGRGVPTIIEMVGATRLDCIIGATATMRQSVTQALHHAMHRSVFGRTLVDQPLMRAVLADLELEVRAAQLLMLRVAATFDRADHDPREALLRRVLTPVAKYWVTKRCTGVVREAMECLGGAGYVEESILPRLFRESPLNAIWEGSGNVIALDVLRAIAREPGTVEALLDELAADGGRAEAAQLLEGVRAELAAPQERSARRLVERIALLVQAALMDRFQPPAIADAFAGSRLSDAGHLYGTLPDAVDLDAILDPTVEALAAA